MTLGNMRENGVRLISVIIVWWWHSQHDTASDLGLVGGPAARWDRYGAVSRLDTTVRACRKYGCASSRIVFRLRPGTIQVMKD
jgi:hypothetical protein